MTSTQNLDAGAATNWTGNALRILVGVALLTASAKVQVPFWPVPMTLQIAVLMTLAATYGLRLGTANMAAYLAAGAAGLPVFAGTPEKGIGLAYMMGGTGGYLLGFLLATIVVALVAERLPKWALLPGMFTGLVAIYVPGLAWLAQFVPADKVFAYGFTPFIAGDSVKVILATILVLGLPAALMTKLRGSSDK